jgi:uncharacterized membrane protein
MTAFLIAMAVIHAFGMMTTHDKVARLLNFCIVLWTIYLYFVSGVK